MNPNDIEQTVLYNLKNNIKTPPDYDLPDLLLYLTLYQIYYMFQNNIIERQEGSQLKNIALEKHKLFNFYRDLYKESVDKIQLAEPLLNILHKNPNLQTAIELIEIYSGEVFNQ